jgi:hypothetical protein
MLIDGISVITAVNDFINGWMLECDDQVSKSTSFA